MRPSLPFRAAVLVAAAVFISAPALAAVRPAPVEVARLACTALVRAHSLACTPLDEAALGGAALDAPAARTGGGAWTADVAVRNLTAQTWGERDATGASGLAVVLSAPVTTLGTGAVGAPDAAALRYGATLAPGAATAAQPWAFSVPDGVEAFTFTAAVLATVSYPRGIVTLTPNPVVLTPAGTQALAASARTRTGAVVPPGLFAWSTSPAAVATVGTDGTVTGVAPGLATITASAGGVSGTAPVCIDPGLAVGGVYHFTLTGGQTICLSGGASGDAEYTLMPMNQTSSSVSLSMTGSGIVAVTGPPSPLTEGGAAVEEGRPARPVRLLPDGTVTDEPLPGEPALDIDAMDRAEFERIERDRAELTPLLARPDTRVEAGRAPVGAGGGDNIIPPGVPAVGDLWHLNVAQGCSGALDIRAGRVRALSAHFVVVEDTLNPVGGRLPYVDGVGAVTTADSIANRAERLAWNPLTPAFGQPTDLDTNQRVVLFLTRAVNELSPPASSLTTFAYSAARDLFSSAPTSCPRSNEGEIMYLLVPDPTGTVNSNVRTVSSVVGTMPRFIGRELYRITNNSRRLYVVGTSTLEEAWLDTGLANVAEELIFYSQSVGLQPRQNIVVTQLTTGPNASRRVAAFNAYANINYGRLRSWLQRPDTSGVYARTGAANDQGSTWAFLRYAVDRRVNAGGGTENAFWSGLISDRTGLDNLRNALGLATEADVLTWVRDWTVAMYADDAVSGIAPVYTNPSWNYRSIYIALNTSYQLVPRNLTNDVALTLSYRRKGGTAYMRAGVPTGTFATFSAGPSLTATIPFSVVRTK